MQVVVSLVSGQEYAWSLRECPASPVDGFLIAMGLSIASLYTRDNCESISKGWTALAMCAITAPCRSGFLQATELISRCICLHPLQTLVSLLYAHIPDE